jgi:hypothetical protein
MDNFLKGISSISQVFDSNPNPPPAETKQEQKSRTFTLYVKPTGSINEAKVKQAETILEKLPEAIFYVTKHFPWGTKRERTLKLSKY